MLQPRHRVQEIVLRQPAVRGGDRASARASAGVARERARAEAEKMFREIAANMNSTFLALLNSWSSARSSGACSSSVERRGPREGRRVREARTRSCWCRATARTSTS